MAARRKTIVRVETTSLLLIRATPGPVNVWCAECAALVPMVTPERAALLEGTTVRAVYRRVEEGSLHYEESENGQLMICCRRLAL